MRFIIQDGMPYLISGGRAFPVEITENKDVIVDRESGFETKKIGCLMLDEVIAKIGYTKKQTEPQEEPEEQTEDSGEDPEDNLELKPLSEEEPPVEKKPRRKADKE